MNLAIGIDLGTSCTSVGVFRNDCFEIITNEEGQVSTPSFVSFTDNERLIGDRAKSQLASNPQNTIFALQRLDTRRWADPDVQREMKNYPFVIQNNKNGVPCIEVRYKGRDKFLTILEVISMILRRMKDLAEKYLGFIVHNAIITCPTYWTLSQRQSIKDAAEVAGLNAFRIIDSPTCAAIAYDNNTRDKQDERNVLFFDVGGGNTNITLATIDEGVISIKSVVGDNHLGGEDFNDRLVAHFINEFKRKYQKDISTNARSLCRLRSACERAKCDLSSSTTTTLEMEHLFDGIDFKSTLSRARFEELCEDLFRSTLTLVERVLSDGRIDKSNVQEIVLVGGSTRIPKIQGLITQYFDGREPVKSINPDLAPCFGAAIQAALLSGDLSSKYLNNVLLSDVQPFSLGIETLGLQMNKIVHRNTSIPTMKSECFDTSLAKRTGQEICILPISVFEGESMRVKNNKLLGQFELQNMSSSSGDPRIEVTFRIGANCTDLDVVVRDQDSRELIKKVAIKPGQLSKAQIEQMKAEAETYVEDERSEAARISAKTDLESQISFFKTALESFKPLKWFKSSDIEYMETETDKILMWMDENDFASSYEYAFQRKELAAIERRAKDLLSKG